MSGLFLCNLAVEAAFAHNRGMDNQPPPPKPRPANANKSGGVYAQKKVVSRESRFVGYMVLGLGVVAVIAVLMIAASKFGGKQDAQPLSQTPMSAQNNVVTPNQPVDDKNLQARVAQDLLSGMKPVTATPVKPVAKKELYFRREPDLNAPDIEGAWQTMISKSTAVLQMNGGTYQIVIADPKEYSRRLYSAGTYKVLEDIILLTPRLDWPAPQAPKGTDVNYAPITSAEFPVVAAIKSGKMLWQNPPSSETRIYVPRAMPLLLDVTQGYIVWQKVK